MRATRETDLIGWYEEGAILAVIFTSSLEGKNPITEVLHSKVVAALRENLDHRLAPKLVVTVHLFPESWDQERPDRVADIKLYPELSRKNSGKRVPMIVKRVIDIVGQRRAVAVLLPDSGGHRGGDQADVEGPGDFQAGTAGTVRTAASSA